MKLNTPQQRFQVWLGATIAALFVANMAAQYFLPVPTANKEMLNSLTNTLINVFLLVVGYFYGKSTNEAETAQALARSVNSPELPPTPATPDALKEEPK